MFGFITKVALVIGHMQSMPVSQIYEKTIMKAINNPTVPRTITYRILGHQRRKEKADKTRLTPARPSKPYERPIQIW